MRCITEEAISDLVRRLCVEANLRLPDDVMAALQQARETETSPRGRWALDQIVQNAKIAEQEGLPICQDTGVVFCFVRLGQDAKIVADLESAINDGVRAAYTPFPFRASVLADPLRRDSNTGDNPPAIIHMRLAEGENLEITVAVKGGGSENAGAVWMLTPAAGPADVIRIVVERVKEQGGKWCPPGIIGVGIGGSMERAALLAKMALLRPLGKPHPEPAWAELEKSLLQAVNATGIGPMGLGGKVTALSVNVEYQPCHIASMPVAVAFDCHAARHATGVL
ncbi:MAG: fumarate hydratase [Armatimonadetes bacterium]|nr:fumarate hydratase [Armatimonadota bacterium]